MNTHQTAQSMAARYAAEPKRTPRLKPTDKVYYNGRIMAVVSHSGHRRIEDFTGAATWVPLYELAPVTAQGVARRRARTISVPEHLILKDYKP